MSIGWYGEALSRTKKIKPLHEYLNPKTDARPTRLTGADAENWLAAREAWRAEQGR